MTFLASVNYTGKTSMEVGVKVMTESIHDRSVRHTNSCYFTMVAVDDEGRPTPVLPLKPDTSFEKRRYAQALQRKMHRAELTERYRIIRDETPEAL